MFWGLSWLALILAALFASPLAFPMVRNRLRHYPALRRIILLSLSMATSGAALILVIRRFIAINIGRTDLPPFHRRLSQAQLVEVVNEGAVQSLLAPVLQGTGLTRDPQVCEAGKVLAVNLWASNPGRLEIIALVLVAGSANALFGWLMTRSVPTKFENARTARAESVPPKPDS
jgi:hypothetical protein